MVFTFCRANRPGLTVIDTRKVITGQQRLQANNFLSPSLCIAVQAEP